VQSVPDDIDITGFQVEASDGAIGRVDEVMRGPGEIYIVIDTGPWIFGKKVLVPVGIIERIDRDDETVRLAYAKDVIKNAPEFDEGGFGHEYRQDLGAYYARLPGGPDVDPKEERRLYSE
jgi:hypothetical protein